MYTALSPADALRDGVLIETRDDLAMAEVGCTLRVEFASGLSVDFYIETPEDGRPRVGLQADPGSYVIFYLDKAATGYKIAMQPHHSELYRQWERIDEVIATTKHKLGDIDEASWRIDRRLARLRSQMPHD